MPNPGSFNEIMESCGISDRVEGIIAHSRALEAFRNEQALACGVDIEELHILQGIGAKWLSSETTTV